MEAIAAYSTAHRIEHLFFIPLISIATSMVTLIGMFIGAKRNDLIDKVIKNIKPTRSFKEDNEDDESPMVSVSNINDSDSDKSDLGDLFAEKIEVRPQVRQLLDKYVTISIDQLTKEIKEVSELLARK